MVSGGPTRWTWNKPGSAGSTWCRPECIRQTGFLVPGWSAATACGKKLHLVGANQLAPPPVRQELPVSTATDQFPRPQERRGSISARPDLGSGGWKNLLASELTAFPAFGKTGFGPDMICSGAPNQSALSSRVSSDSSGLLAVSGERPFKSVSGISCGAGKEIPVFRWEASERDAPHTDWRGTRQPVRTPYLLPVTSPCTARCPHSPYRNARAPPFVRFHQKGRTASPGILRKSFRLLVTKGMPWARTVAAIHKSLVPISVPFALR